VSYDDTSGGYSANLFPAGRTYLLLTGGTGFFGRSILRFLLSGRIPDGAEIDILTRDPDRFVGQFPALAEQAGLRFVKGDILRPETLPWSANYTHILHAAADSTIGPRLTPLERHDQIVVGTRNILDLAIRTRARRFLLTSSGAVYGRISPPASCALEGPQDMLDPLAANHTHVQSKREAEHLCALYREAHGLETVVARCFSFVGPDLPLDVHFAIGNFIRDALCGEEIVVSGDGTPIRSYLFQEDLAEWLLQILFRGKAGTAYDVGSDQPISIADLARCIRDRLAPGKNIRMLGRTANGGQGDYYVPDISRAKSELGLAPKVSLIDGILKTAEYVVALAAEAASQSASIGAMDKDIGTTHESTSNIE
jgi:dTDP-glucose 4,6-dehydratase